MIHQESLKKRLAKLAAPIFIETLLIMMLGAVDTIMLSRHSGCRGGQPDYNAHFSRIRGHQSRNFRPLLPISRCSPAKESSASGWCFNPCEHSGRRIHQPTPFLWCRTYPAPDGTDFRTDD